MDQLIARAAKKAVRAHIGDPRIYNLAAISVSSDGRVNVASNIGAHDRNPEVHAEARVRFRKGATVFVVRVRKLDGSLTCAKPCSWCVETLEKRGAAEVWYSDWEGKLRRL